MKHTTLDLYGIPTSDFIELNYIDALVVKHNAAQKMVHTYMYGYSNLERPDMWMECYEAIKHNRALLEEANMGHKITDLYKGTT
jgi:hypothetical protein